MHIAGAWRLTETPDQPRRREPDHAAGRRAGDRHAVLQRRWPAGAGEDTLSDRAQAPRSLQTIDGPSPDADPGQPGRRGDAVAGEQFGGQRRLVDGHPDPSPRSRSEGCRRSHRRGSVSRRSPQPDAPFRCISLFRTGETAAGVIPDSFSRQLFARPLMSTTPVNNSPRPTGVLPTMRSPSTRTLALALASVAAIAALGGASAAQASAPLSDDPVTLSLVAFSVPKAGNDAAEAAFAETPAGANVTWETSYGASGDQSRAVAGGLHADFVHFSLEPDMTRLVDAGLVAAGLERRSQPRHRHRLGRRARRARGQPQGHHRTGPTSLATTSASSPPTPDRRGRHAGTSSPPTAA